MKAPALMCPPSRGHNGTANLDEIRGSGLLLIRTFMDQVRHNPLGNEITMIKRRPAIG